MHRQIDALKWSHHIGHRPKHIPVQRARGIKALGVRYERALAKAIPGADLGIWWAFEDINGLGYCQTDITLCIDDCTIMVIEVKHSWVPSARGQLEDLYLPVLRKATGREVFGLVACKRLVPGINERIFGDLQQAMAMARNGVRSTWHCPVVIPQGASKRSVPLSADQLGL